MAYASLSRRAIATLMIPAMLAACSADGLVPPASIDTGMRVGAISPPGSVPRQQGYAAGPSPVSQVGAYDPSASTGDGGHYLRVPGSGDPATTGNGSNQASQPFPSDTQQSSASRQMPASRQVASAGPTRVPDEGVNMDSEFGFGPDESDVTGLAEEEDSDIAEGVGGQPVVTGIGTENPTAVKPRGARVQQMSASMGSPSDDRVIVPPKRAAAGQQGDMSWGDGSQVVAPGRLPPPGQARNQQLAMLRPNNPAGSSMDDAPMSRPDQPFLREVMPQSEVSCRAELRRLGVEFEDRPRISNGQSCGIDYPVKLGGLSGGIDVKPAVTLNCQTTLAFAKWVKNELAPSARLRYLTGVRTIVPLGGYSCRRMNNSSQRYNPMSEHAKGNAIDIGSIVLKDGHDIDVRKKGLFSMREGGLLKAVRNDSCKYFSTVLGPGSNAEHWNHFHFDLRSRRGGKRYCD